MPDTLLHNLLRERPIVVTGMGAVSVAGRGADALWVAARDGRCGARWLEADGAVFAGCPAPLPDWTGHAWRPLARRLDPSGSWALAAADEAAQQARWGELDPRRLGVVAGTSRGPMEKWIGSHAAMAAGKRLKATTAAVTTLAAVSGALGQALGARGPCFMVSTACASSGHALALAAQEILLGNVDAMAVAGADEALHAIAVLGLDAAGVLATGAADENPVALCRPFDASSRGLVPGSGAGVLILESETSARQRGAPVLGRLAGWASAFEPSGLAGVDEDGLGLQRVMRGALAMAGEPRIDYVNAHGTGTRTNDAAEARAIRAVFGDAPPPVSSTKPVTGHCLGATPVLEAIICLQALRHGLLPPTATCVTPDPESAIDPIPGSPRPAVGARHAVSIAHAFWGFATATVWRAQ